MQDVLTQAKKAKAAAKVLKQATTAQKNDFLNNLAKLLGVNLERILEENQNDLKAAENLTSAMKRRLTLNKDSVLGMVESVKQVISLPDPIGQIIKSWTRPNGLVINKVRTPIGVIACIFESRPNVIIDVASLCAKSGNPVIVRGGKEARYSNDCLMSLIEEALVSAGLPKESAQQLEDRRHEAVGELV